MADLKKLRNDLKLLENPKKAQILQRFFKTGPGQYGEGDIFFGITVPQSRLIAQKYKNLSFLDIKELLKSKIHEERLIALLILVHNFQEAEEKNRQKIYNFYLESTKYINNWDLVDLSADKIVGEYLFRHTELVSTSKKTLKQVQGDNMGVLKKLSVSPNFWERRIAIIATFQFIKNNQFEPTLQIAKILLNDKHDLIHKAVGWMLREVGKRNQKAEEEFLRNHYSQMPRTALRYAIERFDQNSRLKYL